MSVLAKDMGVISLIFETFEKLILELGITHLWNISGLCA